MTAQDDRATSGRPVCYATIFAASFHPPSLALSLARATLLCENMSTHTPSKPCSHRAKPMPPTDHDAILLEVQRFQQQFVQCHQFLADNTHRLAELLREAESRGILLQDGFKLADVGYWLQNIDWQTKFLGIVLAFAQGPSRATLRPLIELYGRDRERMKFEVEILERQLKHRLAHFAKPDDATVRKAITKNEQRILAVYLHTRAGYGGAALARFFKVPRTTAYGWLDWFKMLPEGLQAGILAFMDTQAPMMAACQVPAVVPKAAAPKEAGQSGSAAPVAQTA